MFLSPIILEQNGWWRVLCIIAVASLALSPVLPLVREMLLSAPNGFTGDYIHFFTLLSRTAVTGAAAAVVSLVLGMTVGILNSLYNTRGRKFFIIAFIFPLVVPPLLWANGIRNLDCTVLTGYVGLGFVTVLQTVPLVTLVTSTVCSSINREMFDSARMAGGEWRALRLAARFAFPYGVAASCAGIALMLSSPGPGLALGAKTAISEILVSFSALFNIHLAVMQCVILSSTISLLVVFAMFLCNRRYGMISGKTGGLNPACHEIWSYVTLVTNIFVLLILVFPPLYGLLKEACRLPDLHMLFNTLARTLWNTFFYAGCSAIIASVLGLIMALAIGKFKFYKRLGSVLMLLIITMPSIMTSLGFVVFYTSAPEWTDFILRTPLAVCIAQGLRIFPIPALFLIFFLNAFPSSWVWAAGLQGISLKYFCFRIMLPISLQALWAGFILSFLIAAADVGTFVMLHPPGVSTLPLSIFTIMANAPSSLVAWLCIVYMVAAFFLLASLQKFGVRRS
jgi:ABC-type Fe3+ transport system permease subunit